MKTYKDYVKEYTEAINNNKKDYIVNQNIYIFFKWTKDKNINFDNIELLEKELKNTYAQDKELFNALSNAIETLNKNK